MDRSELPARKVGLPDILVVPIEGFDTYGTVVGLGVADHGRQLKDRREVLTQ